MGSFVTSCVIQLAAAVVLNAAACNPLPDGETRRATASRQRRACFTFEVGTGEATQLTADQREDLVFHVTFAGGQLAVDSFDFGSETATITNPGKYIVEIYPADATIGSVSFTMSRKPLALHDAFAWRAAEELATHSKATLHTSDVQKSLESWEALGNRSALARTYVKAGDAAIKVGDMLSARSFYEKALDACRSLSDLRCQAEAANNSGLAAQQSGDFEAAAQRLTEAAGDWRKLDDKASYGITLSNMGLLYWYTNDFERAISYYDQARQILRVRDPIANAKVMNNLGLAYQSMGEYGTAQSYFEQAIAVESPRADEAAAVVHARLNLGRNTMLEGRTLAAQRILNRTVEDARKLEDQAALGDALNAAGQNLLARNQPRVAHSVLEEALQLHRQAGDKRAEASDLHCLGSAALAEGDTLAARPYLLEAIEIRKRSELPEKLAESLAVLAAIDRDAGDLEGARDLALQALDTLASVRSHVPGAELRASFYALKRQFVDLLVGIEMTSKGPGAIERGLLAAERGRARALLDLLAEGSILHRIPPALRQRQAAMERQINLTSYELLTAKGSQEAILRKRIQSLIADNEAVTARIRETSPDHVFGASLSSVDELRNLLPTGCALIEYHLAAPKSYLWLVRREGVQVYVLPPRTEIETVANRVIRLFNSPLDRKRSPSLQSEFDRAMNRLSGILLGPIPPSTLGNRLIIVPDGILNQTPFAALPVPGRKALGLEHDLIQIPAASFLAAGRNPRPVSDFPQAFLGVADPVFSTLDARVPASSRRTNRSSPDLPRLPFTGELELASEKVPQSRRKILRGFEATKSTVQALRLADFAVLHFSTHALVDDRIPELSRIALSMVTPQGQPIDGFLRPYDLAALRLNGSTVVLSACRTALGKQVAGEGLLGLTASLFQAGAAQLVLSLSEVDAEASEEFFSRAYAKLFSSQSYNMESALTAARQSLSQSARWSDPFYWASFVVIGRPSEFR